MTQLVKTKREPNLKILNDLDLLRGSSNQKTLYSTRSFNLHRNSSNKLLHSPVEKAEHHYYLKIYRRGMWLLFFNQSFETL
jgi:hypothetical protein